MIRKAGTEIRCRESTKLSRTVGCADSDGLRSDGLGHQRRHGDIDRPGGAVNIVATVDAFLSSGFTPAELMRWVHLSLVASTQGTGMGGMTSMQTMYHGNLLGGPSRTTSFRKFCRTLLRHTSFSRTSAATVDDPSGRACATAAVSVEEGHG